MKAISLLLRFLLELAALAALGYAGLHAATGTFGILLCIALPLVFAFVWWLFPAHKAKFPPPQPLKAVIGAALLQVTPLVLVLEGQGLWAGIIAVGIVANSMTVYLQKSQ